MANTQNLDLVKPLGTDHALVSVLNSNSDKIDAYAGAVNASLDGLREGMGILADGNTHAAITSGQFVYVKNHQTLPQGLYQATTNIAANGTLSTSNLTADPKGGLNTLSEQIGNLFAFKEYTITHGTILPYAVKMGSVNIAVAGYVPFAIRSYSNSDDHMILYECSMTSLVLFYRVKNYDSSAISDASTTIRIAYVKSPATVTELT